MCIICVEFNRTRDLEDARRMIEAARREADVVPERHLRNVEKALEEMQATDQVEALDLVEKGL